MNILRIIGLVIGYLSVVVLICQVVGFNRIESSEDRDESDAQKETDAISGLQP